jgi:hypothetical protein
LRQTPDCPKPYAGSASGRVTVREATGDIREAGAAIEREYLDTAVGLLAEGANDQLPVLGISCKVIAEFRYDERRLPSLGFRQAYICRKPCCDSARLAHVTSVRDGHGK